jgi:hypothetical protein
VPISARSRQIAHGLGRDGIEQPAPLAAVQHRRLAGRHHIFRAADGGGRVGRHHPTGDEPIEQRPHRRELLLHPRRPVFLLKLFDPGCYVV